MDFFCTLSTFAKFTRCCANWNAYLCSLACFPIRLFVLAASFCSGCLSGFRFFFADFFPGIPFRDEGFPDFILRRRSRALLKRVHVQRYLGCGRGNFYKAIFFFQRSYFIATCVCASVLRNVICAGASRAPLDTLWHASHGQARSRTQIACLSRSYACLSLRSWL